MRSRPLNSTEKGRGCTSIIDIDADARTVQINNPANANDSKSYTFDGVYDANTLQKVFYEDCCFALVENVLEGFNGTIFAYGQTGCGKSHTMQGPSTSDPEMRGVIPNSFAHIFDTVIASTDVEYLIHCSYLEIYNEEIKDLLAPPSNKKPVKCDLKEDPNKGVFVKNLTDVMVKDEDELAKVLDRGVALRTTAETKMNEASSRSHSIFTIVVEMSSKDPDTGKESIKVGKLNLVDLAGSERQKKTGASGAVLKEGAKINLSLSSLGNVISALSEAKPGKHIPYRDSKLTRLLQDSLGGNTKTLMVAAISPADYNHDETGSTLRYANRAKNIQNKPKINEDPKDTMMRELRDQVAMLKKMLAEAAANGGALPANMPGLDMGGGAAAAPQQQVQMVDSGIGEAQKMQLESEKQAIAEALQEERQRAAEMEKKMMELQSKLVGSANEATGGIASDGGGVSEEKTAEQMEIAAKLKERRLRAKKKKEAKRLAKMERIAAEKRAMEEEMEDILEKGQGQLDQLTGTVEEQAKEHYRKLVKLKRRYEKKLQASRTEVDEIMEEATYQRQQLLDSLREQEKDTRLYEEICLSLMPESELRKIVNKCRYDEDEDYWIVPYMKRKSFDNGNASSSVSGGPMGGPEPNMNPMAVAMMGRNINMDAVNMQDNYSTNAPSMMNGGSLAPIQGGVSVPTRRGSKDSLPSLGGNSAPGGMGDEYGEITFQGGSAFGNPSMGGQMDYNMQSGAPEGSSFASLGQVSGTVVQDMNNCGILPNFDNGPRGGGGMPSILPNVKGGGGGSMLPGMGGGGLPSMGGGGEKVKKSKKDMTPEELEARARKKAKKKAKMEAKMRQQQQQIDQAGYTDEAGTGETADAIGGWDWADPSGANKDEKDEDPEYSDDDFEIEGGSNDVMVAHPPAQQQSSASKGNSRSKQKGGGVALPSI